MGVKCKGSKVRVAVVTWVIYWRWLSHRAIQALKVIRTDTNQPYPNCYGNRMVMSCILSFRKTVKKSGILNKDFEESRSVRCGDSITRRNTLIRAKNNALGFP